MTETLWIAFGMPLTRFGAMCATSMMCVLLGAALFAREKRMRYGAFIRLAVLSVPLSWLCARLLYVLANCTYYLTTLSNPALALRFWDGGYSAAGAMLGLWLAAWLAAKWTHIPACDMLDAVSLGIPLGLLVERLSESGTSMGLGRAVSYAWLSFLGISDGMGDLVHPVYRYEAAAALVIFLVLAVLVLRKRGRTVPGDVTLILLILLGATQVVLESLRNDGHMVVHFVRIQQVVYLLESLLALLIYFRRAVKNAGMKKSRQLLLWLTALACVALGILMEFRVDRGALKWLYYTVMALCMGGIAAMALHCRKQSQRKGRYSA